MNMKKRIMLLLIFAIIFHSGFYCRLVNAKNLVQIAQAEIGNGELGSNNSGYHVRRYLNGKENLSWCAAFVSFCLKESGSDFGYKFSAKEIFNIAKKKGYKVNSPLSGDLVVFWRESKSSWKGHIGIIEKVDENYIYTIEGNVGKFPSKVKRFKYDKNNVPKLLGYLRIEE